MAPEDKTVYTDDEVATQILGIVRSASSYVLLITPYLNLWGHLQDALEVSVKRWVKITVVVRDEPHVVDSEDVHWLIGKGMEVSAIEGLHSKIYLSEKDIIVSSMNLTEYSTKNSLEIALKIRGDRESQQIRDYVFKRLKPLSRNITAIISCADGKKIMHGQHDGFCVRCGNGIELDPSKPLCPGCYNVWAEWNNIDYPEEYCHGCGKPAQVNYARPLCRPCYQGSS